MTLDDSSDNFLQIVSHIQSNSKRYKRSLLPLENLFSFLFGTAIQGDLDSIKAKVKEVYEKQVNQAQVLTDIVSITNVSRSLINENRLLTNGIIQTVITVNSTLK